MMGLVALSSLVPKETISASSQPISKEPAPVITDSISEDIRLPLHLLHHGLLVQALQGAVHELGVHRTKSEHLSGDL